MSYLYSNLAQEDTTNTKKKKKKQMRVKNAIVLKKPKKCPKSPILKKEVIAGG
jgi:hypothetical protein